MKSMMIAYKNEFPIFDKESNLQIKTRTEIKDFMKRG